MSRSPFVNPCPTAPPTPWMLIVWLVTGVRLVTSAPQLIADEPFPVRVTRQGAEIKDVDQVVGKAAQDMLLWTERLSPDGQWAYVKVPASSRMGWISVGDVANITIPSEARAEWTAAHDYFAEWQELVDVGLFAEAATLAESSARTMESVLQQEIGAVYPGYPPAATAWNQAGVARLRAGDAAAAQALFQRAMTMAEAALGARHPTTSVYRANLADTLVRSGRLPDAISAFDVALPVLEKADSDVGVALDGYQVRYGSALASEHRLFDARIAFRKALQTVTARHGERSAEVAHVQTQFASALDRAGQHAAAVRELERSLAIYREIVDPEHPLMIDTLNRLSAFSARADDFSAARKFAEEAVAIQRRQDQPRPFALASALSNLGFAQTETGQLQQAAERLAEAVTIMEQAAGEQSLATTFPRKNLGWLALKQGDIQTANAQFERVLTVRREQAASDDLNVAAAHRLLAEAAQRAGETELATTHLLDAVRIQGAISGIDHPDTRSTIQRLRALDRPDAQMRLDQLIVQARTSMRQQVWREMSSEDAPLDRVASEYRLQRVLSRRQQTPPETQFFALEIVSDNARIRTDDLIPTTLPKGTVVYAFRAQGDQALIRIPGRQSGWIAEDSVREIRYAGELLDKLAAADARLDQGLQQHLDGQHKEALQNIRQALQVFDTELGADSAPAAAARFTLGGVLAAAGDARVAVEECRRAEAVLVDLLGETHFETAKARNNLADALLALGQPAEALRPAALALQTASGFGETQREFQAKVAGNVGLALLDLTHYEAAADYFDHALQLSLAAHGEDHFATARCYSHLGRLHTERTEYRQAEARFASALQIARRVSGPTTADTTRAMVRYGEALIAGQKIAAGRRLIEEAARINLSERGPMDLSTIQSDAAAAGIALSVGDAAAARTMLESVLERATRRLGDEHPHVLQYQMQLADALYLDDQLERALALAEQAATRLRTAFDDSTHATIDSFRSVGVYSAALGRLDVARMNFEQAFRLARRALGPDHPDTTQCLLNIGEVALMARDYVAARPRIEAAIWSLQQEGRVVAEACRAQTMLGYIDVSQQDPRAAVAAFDAAARQTFTLMSTVLPALSEKEQLLFLQEDLREMQDAWLTLPVSVPDRSTQSAAAVWHLNMKASSHELLATQARLARDSGDLSNQAAFAELIKVREQLARLSLRTVGPDELATHREAVTRLTREEERLSRELGDQAQKLTQARSWIEQDAFRQALAEDSVFVNFARIRSANFSFSSERTRWKGERYLAFVFPPTGAGDVVAVDLGLADTIDQRIAAALQQIQSPETLTAIRTRGEQETVVAADAALQALAARVLTPLLPHIDRFDRLILSPDGPLWTVPWAALPISVDGESRLAIERFPLRLTVSGRELLQRDAPSPSREHSAPVIVADPAFDRNPQVQLAFRDPDLTQTRSTRTRFGEQFRHVRRLPGTAAEAAAIEESLTRFAGAAPRMFLQQTATEAVVKTARRPQCLVLSTHGFFFEAPTRQYAKRRPRSAMTIPRNPLLRCGLLLAGCHFADQTPPGEDDGILTGMEIISSDLRDTELVVLSACETGLGDLRSGEGVAGLRQAFQLAGAKSVVASLWQVEDRATARLMNDFFSNLAAGMTKSEALRQAQLSRITSRRERHGAAHPFFWAAFTLNGAD